MANTLDSKNTFYTKSVVQGGTFVAIPAAGTDRASDDPEEEYLRYTSINYSGNLSRLTQFIHLSHPDKDCTGIISIASK